MKNADKDQIIPLGMGLDLVSPGLAKAPDAVIACKNYEVNARGYVRCEGYERLDGRGKPSEAFPLYDVLFTAGLTEPTVNELVVGETSGAQGYVYATPVLTSGSYVGNDAAGTLVLRNVTGTFEAAETITQDGLGGSDLLTASGAQTHTAFASDTARETARQAAVTQARDEIEVVAGEAEILGLSTYEGQELAFRKVDKSDEVKMFGATTGGWVDQKTKLDLGGGGTQKSWGWELYFASGTTEFLEGETVSGGAGSATIVRVVLTSGAWDGTAAGYMVVADLQGTFSAVAITSASGAATANGAQREISLPINAKIRSIVHNFYGTSNLRRLYFVTGEGPAYEWDGNYIVPIHTGLSDSLDKPTHIAVHNGHLLLGYRGGSVLWSGTGLPLSFTAITGAGEVGLGEDITGMISETKTATIITGRNKISYFTGNDENDFSLDKISEDSGAIADTLQSVGKTYLVDDNGLRSIESAASFGDWDIGTASRMAEPFFKSQKNAGLTVIGSMRVRQKNQYRLFWSDGTGLSFYFGEETPRILSFDLGITPKVVFSGEKADGDEILLVGDDTGLVYELDAGQQHDGAAMDFFLRLAFAHQNSPNYDKRYRWGILDIIADGEQSNLKMIADYSYGEADMISNPEVAFATYGTGGFWDEAVWDEGSWDSPVQNSISLDLNALGKNVSMVLFGSATWESPHVFSSLSYFYSFRKKRR